MIQRSAQDLQAQGFLPQPLDKSPPPFLHLLQRRDWVHKTRKQCWKVMKSPTYHGKKNKMRETSIAEVKLPVDWMINKGKVPRTNISHTRTFAAPSAALLFSFLWRVWHNSSWSTLALLGIGWKLNLTVSDPEDQRSLSVSYLQMFKTKLAGVLTGLSRWPNMQ